MNTKSGGIKLGRRFWGAVVVVIVIVLAGFAFRPQGVPVEVAVIGRGPLMVTVDEEARTRVRDVYTVSAPLGGTAQRVDLDVGDMVAAGDTVATIVPSDPGFLDRRTEAEAQAAVLAAEAALLLAGAEVDEAQARVDFAERELERARSLADRGTVSVSTLDRAQMQARTDRATLATAQAGLEVRRYELATARAALTQPDATDGVPATCCIHVRAPTSGDVLQVLHESAGVVAAGTPLVDIGDARDLEIVAELLSTEAIAVGAGDPVIVTEWGGSGDLNGIVRRVEPFGFTKISALGVEEQRVIAIVDLTDPATAWQQPGQRLGHGFRVTVRIVTWQDDDVLQVPLAAMFRRGARWSVFVVEDGRARARDIDVGHMSDSAAQIVGGLEAGETVILHPSTAVVADARVTRRETGE